MILKEGTTLKNGDFVVGRKLGKGGFGITYEVEQVSLERRRVLKELFIGGTCERDDDGKTVFVLRSNREFFEKQKRRFRDEAKRIARLSNPHIVQVHDVFEENGTVYYVMDFIEGKSLDKQLESSGRPLGEDKVRDILEQTLDALDCIHSQIPPLCHLDIKPANIMMEGEKVVLIDFGASKYVANAGEERSSSTFFAYTPGYAPVEQLDGNRDEMGPWTDFYALGATLYCLLTGEKPASPSVIDDDHSPNKRDSIPMPTTVSAQMCQLVLWMMARSKKDRPKSVKEIREFLEENKPKSNGESGLSGGSGSSSGSNFSGGSGSGKSSGLGLSGVGGSTNVLGGVSKKPGENGHFSKWMIAGFIALTLVLVLAMGRTCTPSGKLDEVSTVQTNSSNDKVETQTDSSTYDAEGQEEVKVVGKEFVQTESLCPDNKHPHAIDLGLPSGTKWACCNVGADKPEEYGSYFAWGETDEKSSYFDIEYKYYQNENYVNLGNDIAGTRYDVAHMKWGGGWRMPSSGKIKELLDNCDYLWTSFNGIEGGKFTSKKNGKSIFLPAAGIRDYDDLDYAGSKGCYWSSTKSPKFTFCASYFGFESDFAYNASDGGRHRASGVTVRPVSR